MSDWIDELVKQLPHVRPKFVKEVREMPITELQRRVLIGSDWQGSFLCSLDGIKEITFIPGGGIDGCRLANEIRCIVEYLAKHCPLTFENTWKGENK